MTMSQTAVRTARRNLVQRIDRLVQRIQTEGFQLGPDAIANFEVALECADCPGGEDAMIWGEYGFVDAFCEPQSWFANTYLAIDQGPIIVMIENYRTGLLWRLFMQIPEVQQGLRRLGFDSPYLSGSDEA